MGNFQYRDEDFGALLALWRKALPYDGVTREDFVRRVLLDPNFRREGLFVSRGEKGPDAFVLCIIPRGDASGPLAERACITAFGRAPTTAREEDNTNLSKLFDAAENYSQQQGRKALAISPYPFGYFVPGVDRERYPEKIHFLLNRGYREHSGALAADALIGQFRIPPETAQKAAELVRERNIYVEPLKLEETAEFLEFLEKHMPPDWVVDARKLLYEITMGRAPENSIFVARQYEGDGNTILGYCKFEGEHFGPFGVAGSHQGCGIGGILLAKTLYQMRLQGHHAAYVLWTGERAINGVYRRFGFNVTRRFSIMIKDL